MKRGDIVKIKNSGYGVIASYPTEKRACLFRLEVVNQKIKVVIPKDATPKSFCLKNLTSVEPDELAGIDLSEIDLYVIKSKKNLT